MATSIDQYAPILPGEPHSLTEKLGIAQSTGSQRIGDNWSNPAPIDTKDLFCLWHCPSVSWVWRWCNCLAGRDPGGAKCAGTWTASTAGVTALSVFFRASCSWRSEGLFGQSFSVALPVQALKRALLPGVLLCCWASQAHRGGPPWLGSYSVVQCIRHLTGQPLSRSAADADT